MLLINLLTIRVTHVLSFVQVRYQTLVRLVSVSLHTHDSSGHVLCWGAGPPQPTAPAPAQRAVSRPTVRATRRERAVRADAGARWESTSAPSGSRRRRRVRVNQQTASAPTECWLRTDRAPSGGLHPFGGETARRRQCVRSDRISVLEDEKY